MPAYQVAKGKFARADAELLAVPATAGDGGPTLGPGADEVAEAHDLDLAAELQALRFDASTGSTVRVPLRGGDGARTLLVVGLGAPDEVELESLRLAGAAIADAASGVSSVATTLHAANAALDAAAAAGAVVEGIELASYRFDTYKAEADEHQLDTVALYPAGGAKPAALRRGVEAAGTVAAAVRLVRDLVNEPPGHKRPPRLAQRVQDLFQGSAVEVHVLDEEALEAGGYGGLLGVGAGSSEPPRLVELRYRPAGAKRHVALVGKGITFDSGGLSLKPNSGMITMKMDMAGAATVVGVVKAAADLGLKVQLTGLLALAENMPSGTATRPGDVLTIHGGKTVEVLNTDAEGRLVLADALVHASEAKPDAIVDLATLTGAVLTALGSRIGGLMARDDDLADALLAASGRTGERLWRLPLPSDLYGKDLPGDVADIKNSGWKDAGTIRAGLFLQEFVAEGIPWAHLDIAGVAWSDEVSGYLRKGGTGVPVRTLVAWLEGS